MSIKHTNTEAARERDEMHRRKRKQPEYITVGELRSLPYKFDIRKHIANAADEAFGKFTVCTATTAELETFDYPDPLVRETAEINPQFVGLLFVCNPGASGIYRALVEWHKEFFLLNGLPAVDYTAIKLDKETKAKAISALL